MSRDVTLWKAVELTDVMCANCEGPLTKRELAAGKCASGKRVTKARAPMPYDAPSATMADGGPEQPPLRPSEGKPGPRARSPQALAAAAAARRREANAEYPPGWSHA